jgi:O-antigen/teichoic acid export membrane protein
MCSRRIREIAGSSRLAARCVRAGLTLATAACAERALRLAGRMMLARLLVPEEFGLVAVIVAVTATYEALTEVGVRESIVQNKRGAEHPYLNVAWWSQAVRGVALFGVAWASAPLVHRFYFEGKGAFAALHTEAELVGLLRLSFVAVLANGLVSPRTYVLRKELRFGKLSLLQQGAGAIGTLVTIGLALFWRRTAAALVIGTAVEAIVRCALSFALCPFKPALRLDRARLRELASFARGMVGLPVLTFIALQADVAVMGRMLEPAVVGMYSMALTLAQTPMDLFSRIVAPVMLPAFAQKQGENEGLNAGLLAVTQATALVYVPALAFMALHAGSLLALAWGAEYALVAGAASLLCLAVLVRTQGTVFASLYLAVGRPHLHRRFTILRAALMAIAIYPAILGLREVGAALSVLLANVVALAIQVHAMRGLTGLSVRAYLIRWIPGMRLGVAVVACSLLLSMAGIDALVPRLLAAGCAAAAVLASCGARAGGCDSTPSDPVSRTARSSSFVA